MAEFGRGKDKGQRKRRSYLGVVGHDAGVGAKIGAGLGAIGGLSHSAALLPQLTSVVQLISFVLDDIPHLSPIRAF